MSASELRVLQRRGTVALAGREIRRVLGLWTQTILPPVITALLFLVIFGGALGGRIHGRSRSSAASSTPPARSASPGRR